MYTTLDKPRAPLAPPAPDDMAALRGEVERLQAALRQAQDENLRYLRGIATWKEIAFAGHGQLAERLLQAERRCSMSRWLCWYLMLKLGEAVKKIAALELEKA